MDIQEIVFTGGGILLGTLMNRNILIVVAMLVLTGCMFKQNPKAYPFSASDVTVEHNIIFCNGKPFAEVKILDFDMRESYTETTPIIGGIAIYYYSSNKEVWIYPEKVLSIVFDGKEYTKTDDIKRGWQIYSKEHDAYFKEKMEGHDDVHVPVHDAYITYNGKHLDKLDPVWFSGVKISDDGKYVYYNKLGWLFDYSRKYLVEYGVSE